MDHRELGEVLAEALVEGRYFLATALLGHCRNEAIGEIGTETHRSQRAPDAEVKTMP